MKKVFFTYIFVSFCALFLVAGIEEDFIKANRFYAQTNYKQAIDIYDRILESGFVSDALFFNLANAHYQNNNFAKAILYYEKAAKISPNDASIQNNLKIAVDKINSDIGAIPEFFLKKYWLTICSIISSKGWAVFSLILLAMLTFFISIWLIHTNIKYKKWSFYGVWSILFLFSLTILFAITKLKLETDDTYAIVMNEDVSLMTSPDKRSELVIVLKAGEKLKLLDKIQNWYKVELLDKESGWLEETSIEKI